MSLGELLVKHHEAYAELKKCLDDCEYDSDYFCYSYEEDLNQINKEIEEEIKRICRGEV